MNKFAQARKNMLDCQLLTNGITDPRVIAAFEKAPREAFLPEDKRGIAYIDEDLPLNDNGFCMEPVAHARMVQAAAPRPDDTVLNIGDATGYSSAILSDLVSTVVTLESQKGRLDAARQAWDECNYCNIAVIKGKETQGSAEHAPYSLIFINGAVASVPQTLLDQLAPNGRLVAVVRKDARETGCITVIEKLAGGGYSTARLYDAATPYVPGFEPAGGFVF